MSEKKEQEKAEVKQEKGNDPHGTEVRYEQRRERYFPQGGPEGITGFATTAK